MMTLKQLSIATALVSASVALVSPAQAVSTNFSASGINSVSGNTLGASATFTVSGNQLNVTLTNTTTGNIRVDGDVLSSVFFNVKGSPLTNLSPTSAVLTSGSTIANPNSTTPTDGNVGGHWAYASSASSSFPYNGGGQGAAGTYGISSTGLSCTSSNCNPQNTAGLFGAANFTTPQGSAVGSIDYGVVNSGFNNAQVNKGLQGTPFINNSVTFTLSGLPSGFTESDISQVFFQYSSASDGPRLTSTQSVPVPFEFSPGLGLLALGALNGGSLLKRKLKNRKVASAARQK